MRAVTEGAMVDEPSDKDGSRRNWLLTRLRNDGALVEDVSGGSSEG